MKQIVARMKAELGICIRLLSLFLLSLFTVSNTMAQAPATGQGPGYTFNAADIDLEKQKREEDFEVFKAESIAKRADLNRLDEIAAEDAAKRNERKPAEDRLGEIRREQEVEAQVRKEASIAAQQSAREARYGAKANKKVSKKLDE